MVTTFFATNELGEPESSETISLVDPMIHMTRGNPRKDHRTYPTAPSIHPAQGMRTDGHQGIVIR